MPGILERLRRAARRDAAGRNPVLEGPVTKTLLGLSIPMIMGMLLVTSFGLVDMLYLGRFSKEAMAAVSLAFPITYLLHTIAGALGTSATSVVSRLIGGGSDRQVRNLVLHVHLTVVVLGVVITPLGILALRPALASTDADPEVVRLAVQYGTIYYLGSIFSLYTMSTNALFRGEGDTIFPFKVMAAALGLNVILDPLFIFGPGPFPRLGVAGAALTTLLTIAVAATLVARELRNPHREVRLDRSAWRFDPGLLRALGAIAGPALVANLAMPVSVYLINHMLVPYGTAALAAFGAGIRLLSFVFLPTLGISLSMMIMVGQNHGAGRRERVRTITLTTLAFCLSLLAALAIPVIAFPEAVMGIFTDDPAVIAAGVPLARWVTLARPMLSVVNVTAFWFQARGNGLAGMVPNTVLRVVMEPLGVYVGLSLSGELAGGWYGMAVGDFLGGTAFLALLLWRLRVYVRGGSREAPAAG
ncbi:MAG: MATE family efflux transporter [Candidatus Krumholzibacteriia bacterium]